MSGPALDPTSTSYEENASRPRGAVAEKAEQGAAGGDAQFLRQRVDRLADTRDRQRRRRAAAAAHQAVTAAAELLRYAADGPVWPGPFGNEEPIEQLADALKMTLELDADHDAEDKVSPDDLDQDRGQLLAAAARYLEDWA